jgi:short-subunit dehydrogenase
MSWALVTGASGGIGKELAKCCARDYDVLLVARSEEQLNTLAAEIRSTGRKAETLVKDLADPSTATEVHRQFTGEDVEVLINNAGIGLAGDFLDIPLEKQVSMLRLNIETLTQLSWMFGRDFVSRKRGKILNLASTAAFQAGPHMAAYFASKAYVLSFSEALHQELSPKGVTVTALCPGPTDTGFSKHAEATTTKLFQQSSVMKPAAVATIGYEAMQAGKPLVVAGKMNRALVLATRFVSRQMSAKLAGNLTQSH